MAIRLSSALRTALVTSYGLGMLLQGGHMRLYAGPQPASADAAETGTLLATITQGGAAPPTSAAPAGGLQVQGGGEPGTLTNRGIWRVRCMVAGEFGWWRWVAMDHDAAGVSESALRLDGEAGDAFDPGEAPLLVADAVLTLREFLLTLP